AAIRVQRAAARAVIIQIDFALAAVGQETADRRRAVIRQVETRETTVTAVATVVRIRSAYGETAAAIEIDRGVGGCETKVVGLALHGDISDVPADLQATAVRQVDRSVGHGIGLKTAIRLIR